MGKLALTWMAAALAIGGVACLVPSFDDVQGDDAKAGSSDRSAESADAGNGSSTSSSGGSTSSTSSSGGGSAPAGDSGAGAKTSTFSCGSSGTRCAIGSQTCCGVFASTEPVCRPATAPGACEGTLPCGDSADCPGGLLCCYRTPAGGPGKGACEASCTGSMALTVCDLQKPTCPGSTKCNGSFWGLPYCL